MRVEPIITLGRRLIADTYLDTCVIADRKEVRDKSGGKTSVWIDRLEGGWTDEWGQNFGGGPALQECRFLQLTDESPKIESGQMFGVPTAMWTAPLGVDVSEGDRLTNMLDNSKWIITTVLTVPSRMAISTRCGIRRAEKGETD